jgi:NADH dehydrogenase
MNMPYDPGAFEKKNELISLRGDLAISIVHEDKPRLVIIGGGFAGLYLAKSLLKADVQIVMLDKNNFHTFQPLLYQVATAMLEPDSVASSFRKIFQNQRNFHFRMVEVERIDPENKLVKTNAGYLAYDYLVIATGARTNFYGMKDIAEHAFTMKDVSEAIAIRQQIFKNFEKALLTKDEIERDALMSIILVGGGPTGVEVAGAIGELKRFILPYDYKELDLSRMRIYMIEAADRLLSGMSFKASQLAQQALEDFSVTLWLNTAITSYDGRTATTSDGKMLHSRMLIWVAGVTGNIPNGIDKPENISGGRLKVDSFTRVTDYDEIYAIGDVAAIVTKDTPKGHPMLAPVAIQQARNLAANFVRITSKGGGKPRPFLFKSHGIMATIGRNQAIVEWPGFSFGGFVAWLTWVFVHVMALVGFRNKIVAFINWAWNYISFDRSIRLIIPSFSDTKVEEREIKSKGT